MTTSEIDRLAILILSGSQSAALMKQLSQEDFHFTLIESRGGLLRESERVLLVGFASHRMSGLLDLLHRFCSPHRQFVPAQGFLGGESSPTSMVEIQEGGAFFYLLRVERFEQI